MLPPEKNVKCSYEVLRGQRRITDATALAVASSNAIIASAAAMTDVTAVDITTACSTVIHASTTTIGGFMFTNT